MSTKTIAVAGDVTVDWLVARSSKKLGRTTLGDIFGGTSGARVSAHAG